MASESPELTVAIPAYREEENLRILLPRLNKVLNGTGLSFEIVIVDTENPLDNTADACSTNHVRCERRRGGNMYGDAVRTAIAQARGKYLLFMDADGSHTPEYLPELIKFRGQYDVVGASRYISGGDTENPWVLILMSRIVNIVYSLVLGIKCKDVSNSFKLYRTEQMKDLSLRCENFDIIEEILFKLNRRFKITIFEVPFTFKKRMFGESKRSLVAFIVTYVITLLKLRFGK